MANITKVPSGYKYYDYSAGKNIEAGGAIPNPENGDVLWNPTGDSLDNDRQYDFYTSRKINGITYSNCWACHIHKPSNSSIPATLNLSPISQIKGYQVVWVRTMIWESSDYTPLKTISGLPDGVKQVDLSAIPNLNSIPIIPNSVTNLYIQNTKIPSLVGKLQEGLKVLRAQENTSLATVGTLPSTLDEIYFKGDTNLSDIIRFDGKATDIENCFQDTTKPIILYGKGNLIPLAKTANNKNVYVNIINRSRIVL